MQIAGTEDIAAPISDVFDMLSEFDSFERNAIRRGIDVRRLNDHSRAMRGLEWQAAFQLRGKPRNLHLVLCRYDRPHLMQIDSSTKGIECTMLVELMPLSPRRTRLHLKLKLRPNTLPARLFVQSLKLARRNLNRRFKNRLSEFARNMENRQTKVR
ncbi:SRPBCC family protein [Ruegeria hyattellae]|uniref:SRPBCC family protein n=1 Tax=Ruegeria hyattellae TaxID=3233337 RepID=UPI00355B0701